MLVIRKADRIGLTLKTTQRNTEYQPVCFYEETFKKVFSLQLKHTTQQVCVCVCVCVICFSAPWWLWVYVGARARFRGALFYINSIIIYYIMLLTPLIYATLRHLYTYFGILTCR